MTAVFSLKDVVRMTGLQCYQIQHAYITGAVEEPRVRISNRRVYEMADIRQALQTFPSHAEGRASRNRRDCGIRPTNKTGWHRTSPTTTSHKENDDNNPFHLRN